MSNGVVEHRKDYFYLEFREEYLIICKNCKYKKPVKEGAKSKASPHCKAFILAILERWTDSKRKKGEDLAIYMSYPMWVEEMHGLFGRNVIIDSLDELLGEGLISREKHRMYGKDTYKYYLNCQELNRRIKLLPPGEAFTSKRDETTDPFTSKSDAFTSKPQIGECRLLVNEDALKSKRNIECNIDSINIDSERKNDAPQQNPNVPAQEPSSHSFALSQLNSSSSQQKEEVVFSPEAEQIYQFAEKLNLVALKKDKNHLESCNTLIEKGVTTFEKLESLKKFVKQIPFYADKTLNLKNLVKELPGWLQTQEKKPITVGNMAYQPLNRDYKTQHAAMIAGCLKKEIARGGQLAKAGGFTNDEVANSDITATIDAWARLYKDAEQTEEHVKRVKQIQYECGFDNYTFFCMMHDVKDDTDHSGDRSMARFLATLAKKLGCSKPVPVTSERMQKLTAGTMQMRPLKSLDL